VWILVGTIAIAAADLAAVAVCAVCILLRLLRALCSIMIDARAIAAAAVAASFL
jgi:hypothetical protein